MVGSGKGLLRPENPDASVMKAIEGLGAGDLVNIVLINIQYIRTIFDMLHHMTIPDLIKKCLCLHFNISFKIFPSVGLGVT
jgi:hypothetical protein